MGIGHVQPWYHVYKDSAMIFQEALVYIYSYLLEGFKYADVNNLTNRQETVPAESEQLDWRDVTHYMVRALKITLNSRRC